MTTTTPPVPCTGAGTVATDLQGLTSLSEFPTHGNCGICGKRWEVDGFFRLVTHPYEPPQGTAGDLAKDERWRTALLEVAAALGGDTWPDDVTPERLQAFCVARIEALPLRRPG